MDQEILKKLDENRAKIDEVYRSVEKMRKYFLWTLIISIVVIVLPAIGLVLVIPQFISTITGAGIGL